MSGAAPGLAGQLARFAGALRAEGVRAGLGDEIDAASALTLVDLLDRAEVHRALRIAFKMPRPAWDLFDRLFEEIWDGNAEAAPGRAPARQPPPRNHRGPLQWHWNGERVLFAAADDEDEEPSGDSPGYRPAPMLRRTPVERCS